MIFFKVIVAGLLVLVSAMIGIKKARKYEDREYILRESITFFKGLENEIKYMLSTMPNAIESLRQGMNTMLKPVLGAISIDMVSNNISSCKIAEEVARLDCLSNYDRQVISNGIINLGSSDVDGQIGIIQNTVSVLETQVSEAYEDKNKNVKLYRTIGVVAGLMIAIVFI